MLVTSNMSLLLAPGTQAQPCSCVCSPIEMGRAQQTRGHFQDTLYKNSIYWESIPSWEQTQQLHTGSCAGGPQDVMALGRMQL